jgi:hypothetical protein
MVKGAATTCEDLVMPDEALAALRILRDLQRMDDILLLEERWMPAESVPRTRSKKPDINVNCISNHRRATSEIS